MQLPKKSPSIVTQSRDGIYQTTLHHILDDSTLYSCNLIWLFRMKMHSLSLLSDHFSDTPKIVLESRGLRVPFQETLY
jgi:hypothetical protein